MHAFLDSIFEMIRPEYRRSGVNNHIHTRVDDLLICVKADEAVLFRNFLSELLGSHLPEVLNLVRENVAKSGEPDSVSSIE